MYINELSGTLGSLQIKNHMESLEPCVNTTTQTKASEREMRQPNRECFKLKPSTRVTLEEQNAEWDFSHSLL